MNRRLRFTLLSLIISLTVQSQEVVHSIGLGIGHSRIEAGLSNGEEKPIVLPTWAIDYNVEISEHFILGLHNELIIESFEYTGEVDNLMLERSTPFASILIAGYAAHDFLFYFGGGTEVSREESFGIMRFGADYAIVINDYLDTFIGVNYDVRFSAYSSVGWIIGLSYKI